MSDLLVEAFECVSEISSDAVAGMVPLPADLISEITDGDDDPKFATIVIDSGWSKSKRLWGPEIFDSVAEQINRSSDEPIVGYLGHITPDQDPFAFPEIHFQWLRSRVQKTATGARIAIKGYVFPGTLGRKYLEKRVARTFSWAGKAGQVPYEKGVKITDFQIKSIDLARPRSAGMSAVLVGGLTSEMEEQEGKVKPEEIAALQPNELRAHAPNLVKSIEDEATAPLNTKISEMETATKTVKPVIDLIPNLKKALGLSDDVDEVGVIEATLTHLKSEGKKLRESVLDSVLAKRFKGGSDADRSLVRRVLVGEMTERDLKLVGDEEKDEKSVSEMVTEIVDADTSLKTLVSEMESAPPAPLHQPDPPAGLQGEWKPGTSTANVRVKARA
jgi:hypothetical protein